jgi:hypothetical protein
MFVIVLVTPGGLFTSRLVYQSNAWSISVIAYCASFLSSFVICFPSQIFSHMSKCFSGSSDASPQNSGNMIMGSCPSILNCVELLPLCSVDI